MPTDGDDGPSTAPRAVLVALALSAAGHVVHNLAEFPPGILLGWETLFPLAVTVALGGWLVARPSRFAFGAAGGWALVVIVGGGGSVLPLGVLPFVPDQSLSHYLAHLVYALAQLPLLWVAYRGLAGTRNHEQTAVTG